MAGKYIFEAHVYAHRTDFDEADPWDYFGKDFKRPDKAISWAMEAGTAAVRDPNCDYATGEVKMVDDDGTSVVTIWNGSF